MFGFRKVKDSESTIALYADRSVEDRSLQHLEIEELTNDLLKTNERLLKHFEEVMKNM